MKNRNSSSPIESSAPELELAEEDDDELGLLGALCSAISTGGVGGTDTVSGQAAGAPVETGIVPALLTDNEKLAGKAAVVCSAALPFS